MNWKSIFYLPLTSLTMLAVLCSVGSASTLIDDFEDYALESPIDGQGDWVSVGGDKTKVVADPLNPSNKVLAVTGQINSCYTKMLVARDDDSQVFRYRVMYSGPGFNVVSSVSTETAPNTWGHIAFYCSRLSDEGKFTVRNNSNGSWITVSDDVEMDRWYDIELHIFNTSNTAHLYIDGELAIEIPDKRLVGDGSINTFFIRSGSQLTGTMYVDDLMFGYPIPQAKNPVPADGAEDIPRDGLQLQWTPLEFAQTHDLYIGKDYNDVNDASIANLLGTTVYAGLDDNNLTLDRREFGVTYYWRVDEVNAPSDPGLYKGSVWSFKIEPEAVIVTDVNVTASSMLTEEFSPLGIVDGSGLDEDGKHSSTATDMWNSSFGDPAPSITFEFTDIYKLHELLIWNANGFGESNMGFGVKDLNVETSMDGKNWDLLGTFEIPQGPGRPGYAANPPLSLEDVLAKYVRLDIQSNWNGVLKQYSLSEVRFTALPMLARDPNPVDGSTDLSPQTTLRWRAGREAAQHEVRLSTDPNALDLVTTSDTANYEASLDLDQTYYWQITEVNDSEIPTSWDGDVWSFSTEPYITIDDFETYKDKWGALVFQAWHDGLGWENPDGNIMEGNGTGSALGYWFPDTTEKTTVQQGRQSMPFAYDSSINGISEATYTLPLDKRNWTQHGIKAMSLWFYGAPENTIGELYIKVNGTTIDTYLYDNNLLKPQWNTWTFDIPAGLSNVKTLTLGIKGGKGLLIIDAIRLYPMDSEMITPVTPDSLELLGHYPFEGNYNDISGNGLNGVGVGSATMSNDASRGSVVSLDGVDSCVDLGADPRFNFPGSFSLTAWVNSPEFTTNWGHTLIAKRGESGMGWSIRRYNDTQNWTFTLRGTDGADELVTKTDMTAYVNEWIQLTAVYDKEAGKRYVYLNGTVVASVNDSGVVVANDHNVYIGARANSDNSGQDANRYFIGMIDDVRIYNRALSHAEVLGLAEQTDPIYKPF